MPRVAKIDGRTLPDAYLRRIEIGGEDAAFLVKKNGKYEPIRWRQVHRQVLALCKTYQKLGLKAGDRVSIMSSTRPEWIMVDLANLCSGIITVPIYQSNIVEDVAFILKDAGVKLVFVEDRPLAERVFHAM